MDPYTQSREIWKCPILTKMGASAPEGERLEIHYTPTRFDARPTTPYRWEKQPWLVEVSSSRQWWSTPPDARRERQKSRRGGARLLNER